MLPWLVLFLQNYAYFTQMFPPSWRPLFEKPIQSVIQSMRIQYGVLHATKFTICRRTSGVQDISEVLPNSHNATSQRNTREARGWCHSLRRGLCGIATERACGAAKAQHNGLPSLQAGSHQSVAHGRAYPESVHGLERKFTSELSYRPMQEATHASV